MSDIPEDLSALVGGEVASISPLRWGFEHHTDLAALADGRRVVIKRFASDGGAAELRRAVAFARRLEAAGIPTPAVVAAEPDRDPPILALAYVPGTTGAEWLDDANRAPILARTMGALAVRLREMAVEADGPDDGPWSDGPFLAEAAVGWLEHVKGRLGRDVELGLTRALEEIPALYAATPPRPAHGDFVPVNVLLNPDGSLAGVLDLGAWRFAHPWLDVAWWGCVVRTFHPDAWAAAWPTLLSSAGVPDDAESARALHVLEVVRCLEGASARDDAAAARMLADTIARGTDG